MEAKRANVSKLHIGNLLLPLMCHVLIIEDEPLMAMLILDLLEDEGATSFRISGQ
jgi:hypothetical protein